MSNWKTLYYGLEFQVVHLDLMTNAGPLCVFDVHDTWLHFQKLTYQVSILLIHALGAWSLHLRN